MLCSHCCNVNFTSSSIQTESPPDFYGPGPFPAEAELPSDSTGQFFVHLHQPNIKALVKSARQGACHLCAKILWGLEQVGLASDSPHDSRDGRIELRWYPHEERLRTDQGVREREVFAVAKTGLRDIKSPFAFVRFLNDSPAESQALTLPWLLRSGASSEAADLNWNTGCDENMLMAGLWLKKCLGQHALCALSTNASPRLPTRVLDVSYDCGPQGNIRLVNGAERHGPYVALSHVWGKSRIITTLCSNMEQRREGIPLDLLSQTFRDAVHITRKLSLQYLWIDSLCIIQDSAADWSAEAAAMGNYYANALITISAVSATGGDFGIFANRDTHVLSALPISIRFPMAEDAPNYQGSTKGASYTLSGFIHPSFEWDPSLETFQYGSHRPPLWRRAWVLQERILPPRLLMFSSAQVSWLCRSERASECIPEGSPRKKESSKEDEELQQALLGFSRYSLTDPSPGLTRLYDAWYNLVTQYTKCDLSVKSDIFPALSGISSSLSRAISGEEFVAGLWRGDLHRGLLWSAVDSTKKWPDLRTYRAPSWSWASLPATCTFVFRQMILSNVDTSVFHVESAVTTPKYPKNPFGEVTAGSLHVVGRLKRAYPASLDDRERDPAFASFRAAKDNTPSDVGLYDLETQSSLGWYMPDNQDRACLSEVWCTPVLSSDFGAAGRKFWHCLAMVIIAGADNRNRPLLMRVGLAWVKDPGWFDGLRDEAFTIV